MLSYVIEGIITAPVNVFPANKKSGHEARRVCRTLPFYCFTILFTKPLPSAVSSRMK